MDDLEVQPENDNSKDLRPDHKLESTSTDPDRLLEGPPPANQAGSSPESTSSSQGVYRWLLLVSDHSQRRDHLVCRHLRRPALLSGCGSRRRPLAQVDGPLAAAWGKDAQTLKRLLSVSYTGLPRGRVTRPAAAFLVLHGDDSPTKTWMTMVLEAFRLSGRNVKFLFDEHETRLPGHLQTVESSLGRRLLMTRREDRDEL